MDQRYELLFQMFSSQQSALSRLQREELERLRRERSDPPDDEKKRPG